MGVNPDYILPGNIFTIDTVIPGLSLNVIIVMAKVLARCFKGVRVCVVSALNNTTTTSTTTALALCPVRSLGTTPALCAGSKYRFSQGKATNNSSYGPLTDLPDYSYLDGRPTELSMCQNRRREKRIEMASRVVRYIKELTDAKKIHQQRLELKSQQQQQQLQKQLKPKVSK
ncbi:hypothetical protein Ahia01_000234000 [Argonauta hians]